MTRKTILIVEDDWGIGSCLQELFEGEGYPVLLANHGKAALDLLAMNLTQKPGLILLDLMMPVMDGTAFLFELQQNYPEIFSHTPIFIMSARNDTQRLMVKTTGIIRKPFDTGMALHLLVIGISAMTADVPGSKWIKSLHHISRNYSSCMQLATIRTKP